MAAGSLSTTSKHYETPLRKVLSLANSRLTGSPACGGSLSAYGDSMFGTATLLNDPTDYHYRGFTAVSSASPSRQASPVSPSRQTPLGIASSTMFGDAPSDCPVVAPGRQQGTRPVRLPQADLSALLEWRRSTASLLARAPCSGSRAWLALECG